MKQKITGMILTLCILMALLYFKRFAPQDQGMAYAAAVPSDTPETNAAVPVYITAPVTSKASSRSIMVSWGASKDALVEYYYVMRRGTKNNAGSGKWKTIAALESDGVKGGTAHSYTDQLDKSTAQQYEYKICTLSKDGAVDTRDASYADSTDAYAVLGTNIKICIDPGHYGTLNNNYEYTGADGRYPYSEAAFTLKTAKALQAELKQAYGIDSYMTRTGKSISLAYNGRTYSNENLDTKNISIRGYMARTQGCDFFISLHTNSTSRSAKPWSQPKSLNKAYVFVNQTAHADSKAMKTANSIDVNLTAYNQESGIQTAGFITRNKNQAPDFSNSDNDSAKTDGTVVYRRKSSGGDYYGVLRGSASAGIPGLLVEHAFHATQIVRKLAAASDDLYENWAACDAYGIAYGFGFAGQLER